jgi:hypothetical protein
MWSVFFTAKFVQVVAGIKKLQIMMTIVDDEVSVDNLIEDYLISEPNNEYIQSCDIVAFNKICEFPPLFALSKSFAPAKQRCFS